MARWFGLRAFVLVAPATGAALDASEMAMLQGALSVALGECGCEAPAFVLHEPAPKAAVCGRALAVGGAAAARLSCRFDVDVFSPVPPHCRELPGLVDLFRAKVEAAGAADRPAVSAAARHTYVLSRWPPSPPRALGAPPLGFAFGAPRAEALPPLALACEWPATDADALLGGGGGGDDADGGGGGAAAAGRTLVLPPGDAPHWRLSVTPGDAGAAAAGGGGALTAAMLSLLDGWASAAGAAADGASGYDGGPVLDDDEVQALLSAVMQQEGDDAAAAAGDGAADGAAAASELGAPPESLLARLGAAALAGGGGAGALVQLWKAMLAEARRRWDDGAPLPHVAAGAPVLGDALVHQKLVKLNCCVAKQEDDARRAPAAAEAAAEPDADGRVGAASELEGLVGLSSGRPLWAPATQEGPPLTSDELEQQQDTLLNVGESLGETAQAGLVMARLQSAQLKSDMQAFKAANPGCELADFVRWHSPRDWIEEGGGEGEGAPRGTMSERMTQPGNVWVQLWAATLPLAATQQRALFDAAKEAQLALQHLDLLSVPDVLEQLVPPLAARLLAAVAAEPLTSLAPDAAALVDKLSAEARSLHRSGAPAAEWRARSGCRSARSRDRSRARRRRRRGSAATSRGS